MRGFRWDSIQVPLGAIARIKYAHEPDDRDGSNIPEGHRFVPTLERRSHAERPGTGRLVVGKGSSRTGVTIVHPRGKANADPVFGAWFTLNGNGETTGTT